MKETILAILVIASIAMPVFAKDYIKATDIQKVSLGDTFGSVIEKIGEPQQVLSKELTTDGREQVVWSYEAIKSLSKKAGDARNVPILGGFVSASDALLLEQQYQIQRASNPPYLVIFINGKVAKIQRQKINPNTNQPIGVVVY